ncbi:4Fe-4S dicluster domain-containing protein [Candidatus Weimeria sp. HCP3S3_B5]|uniref:4Fe-4S dicluster domain-containing protein n=1 Tax=Candidatus Weimeria sp. HCP3S3_B5 TaxID=3438871 RepID=UPI00302F57D1|nr:4Fe-4S dicluster domain-containing protein [Lachnospiraceae bacterium]
MYADEGVIKIKHDVLGAVAKLAFEGNLEAEKEFLPEKLIPGPQAKFRCCIYKEREIIRERVRLACGESVDAEDNGNIIQVLHAACEDCPISSYVVTDNCQNCLGKACVSACKFGACQPGETRSHIDPQKCKECGKCAQACPYHAIAALKRPCKFACPVNAIEYDEYGICRINDEKCIRCGQCIHRCPFGAIASKSFIVPVINAIRSGRPVYAMAAPATEGQFGPKITMNSWKKAMKKLGFKDFIEVGLGGDLTAKAEAAEWYEAHEKGERKSTSCCPAFVNMIRKHYPELADELISTSVSPMCAVSRLVKAKDPEAVCVFIGPCIAKKSEAMEMDIEGNADYALTFSEVRAMMRARDVVLEEDEGYEYQESSIFGKRFSQTGGVANAVLEVLKEEGKDFDAKVCVANGANECKKQLLLLKVGRADFDFIEGMACPGGCVGGPSAYREAPLFAKDRETLFAEADDRGVVDNLANYDLSKVDLYR